MSSFRHLMLQSFVSKDNNESDDTILDVSEQSYVQFVDCEEEIENYPYIVILNRSSNSNSIVPMVFISSVPQYAIKTSDGFTQAIPKECLLYATGQKVYSNSFSGVGGSLSLGVANGFTYYDYNVARTDDKILWSNHDLYYWSGTTPTEELYRQKG